VQAGHIALQAVFAEWQYQAALIFKTLLRCTILIARAFAGKNNLIIGWAWLQTCGASSLLVTPGSSNHAKQRDNDE
jgi:hypothetical protein